MLVRHIQPLTLQIQYSVHYVLLLQVAGILLLAATSLRAQTQASCTFTTFASQSQTATGKRTLVPAGVNDFGTVVGYADNTNRLVQGFTRWSNGSINFYAAKPTGTAVDTFFNDRNDDGVTIGNGGGPFSLQGSSFKPLTLTIATTTHTIFQPVGINKWGTIVGFYGAGALHGFNRWSNGKAIALNYPGAKETLALGINDSGTIVGWYSPTLAPNEQRHGFIYHNGQWATLDYPSSTLQTVLEGIDNAGVITGSTSTGNTLQESFIYKNGTFKKVVLPNSTSAALLTGISPRRGLITGLSNGKGFVAACK